jgi:inward rectifier potassium channel
MFLASRYPIFREKILGYMAQQSFHPGLTQQYAGRLRRSINKDGSFNVRRRGDKWSQKHFYIKLINMRWRVFLPLVILAYVVMNLLFASIYMLLGVENLEGVTSVGSGNSFLGAFFFSAETLTTVGYGHIAPKGILTTTVAVFEGMVGVLSFALATGLLYGRVSRPSARILFSGQALIAPYQGGQALMFRIANQRSNVLMELDATVILMLVEPGNGGLKREFMQLTLERTHVYFFPLSWTIVHPIIDSSPLFGKTAEDLERDQAEIMILIKAFDDTFSQVVHARHSYRHEELVWNAKFLPAFNFDEHGDMVLHLDRLDNIEKLRA